MANPTSYIREWCTFHSRRERYVKLAKILVTVLSLAIIISQFDFLAKIYFTPGGIVWLILAFIGSMILGIINYGFRVSRRLPTVLNAFAVVYAVVLWFGLMHIAAQFGHYDVLFLPAVLLVLGFCTVIKLDPSHSRHQRTPQADTP
jgi:hypothetical protein